MSDRMEGLPGRRWRPSAGRDRAWRPGSGWRAREPQNGAGAGQGREADGVAAGQNGAADLATLDGHGGEAREIAAPDGQSSETGEAQEADEGAESGEHARVVAHRASDADRGEMAEDLRDLAERARILGIALAGIAIDLGFLAGWLGLTKVFHWLVDKLGTVPGISEAMQTALIWVFDIATLTGVVSYVLLDVVKSVKRIWKKHDEDS